MSHCNEAKFGANLSEKVLNLHQKYEDKLEKETAKLTEEINQLSKKFEDFTKLRLKLMQNNETAPRSLDFSHDEEAKKVIDELTKLSNGAINGNKTYRFNETELKTFVDQLDLVTHTLRNQSNNQMLLLHPALLRLLDVARMTHDSLKFERDAVQNMIRNQRP